MANNRRVPWAAGNQKSSLTFEDYKTKLEHLYELQRAIIWNFNLDTIEVERRTIRNMDWNLRNLFYRFLLKEGREDLADFFQDEYLIKMGLKEQRHPNDKGLVKCVKSAMIDLPVAYAAALYEASIKTKFLNYLDWESYQQHLRELSRKEKLAVYRKLNKKYTAAALYFSQNFMFRKVALKIPI